MGIGCALVAALIGAESLVEHFGGPDSGIDGLLYRHAIRPGEVGLPGRMAPVTAFGFTLLGGALALLHLERRFAAAQALLSTLVVLFLLPLVNIAYGRAALDTLQPFGMAVHTAVLFVVVAAAGLWASAHHGFVRVAIGPNLGAQSIRRLLPPLLAVLFVLGWLATGGRRLAYLVGMVLRNACGLVASGLVIGGVAAWFLSAASQAFLFRLEPTDPRAFAAATVSLAVAALAASVIPARRAANVEPMVALRAE